MNPQPQPSGRDTDELITTAPVALAHRTAHAPHGLRDLRIHFDTQGAVAAVAAMALLVAVVASLAGAGVVAGLTDTTRSVVPAWASARPAIRADFADPSALVVGNVYYVYATNAHGKHIQVARSIDLRNWTMLPDALPVLPAWANGQGDWVWAPAVIQVGQQFVMYYTARDEASGRQCVGVATSGAPSGPFADVSARPLVCQLSLGGTIDPDPFRDGDTLYLYFKSDGNCCALPTHIWGQRLTPDGMSLVGKPVALISNDQAWEGAVVEAPDMVAHAGQYDLFYSANNYATDRYAISYARCASPLGPCEKSGDKPLLASAPNSPEQLAGPGGESIFEAAGSTWIAFHAWNLESDGSASASRYLMVERLGWLGDKPVAPAPTSAPSLAGPYSKVQKDRVGSQYAISVWRGYQRTLPAQSFADSLWALYLLDSLHIGLLISTLCVYYAVVG